jgi:hypothetical protein
LTLRGLSGIAAVCLVGAGVVDFSTGFRRVFRLTITVTRHHGDSSGKYRGGCPNTHIVLPVKLRCYANVISMKEEINDDEHKNGNSEKPADQIFTHD